MKIPHMFGLKKKVFIFLVNRVFVGTDKRFFSTKRFLLRSIGYKIGNGTSIVGPIFCTGSLTIGSNCWIGKNFTVDGNGSVVIGNNCDVAPDVLVITGGHKIGPESRRAGEGQSYNILIGNGCWICSRVAIVNSITIGEGAVVAACACVVNDVKPNTIVGGVPARTIKSL